MDLRYEWFGRLALSGNCGLALDHTQPAVSLTPTAVDPMRKSLTDRSSGIGPMHGLEPLAWTTHPPLERLEPATSSRHLWMNRVVSRLGLLLID
jgi:hypothetical protein